jgi:hypothetical protein
VEAIEVGGLVVHTGTVSHPLLGAAHVIERAGTPLTAMSAIDWGAPACIPTIAEPARLPPGSGTLLVNEIARRAQAAGVRALRYAGPYPTLALFASLRRSFRTDGHVDQFTADAHDRALRLARDEVPVDFTPAPFERRGDVDVRDGVVERVRIDGVTYDIEHQPGSLARLEDGRAILTVGVPIALVAQLDGERIVDPRPIPAFAAPAGVFPQQLVNELADLTADFVPAPLRRDVIQAIRTLPVRWADLGHRSARGSDAGFELHPGFLALMQRDVSRFAETISYHLASIAQQTVLAAVLASRR